MAIPFHKLPKLLKNALPLPNITKLQFKYTKYKIEDNEIRLYYKAQAPRIKYHNPQMTVELLQLDEEIQPIIEAYRDEVKLGEVSNDTESIETVLKEINDSASG